MVRNASVTEELRVRPPEEPQDSPPPKATAGGEIEVGAQEEHRNGVSRRESNERRDVDRAIAQQESAHAEPSHKEKRFDSKMDSPRRHNPTMQQPSLSDKLPEALTLEGWLVTID
jgi:hypothetical protein